MIKYCPKCNGTNWAKKVWVTVCNHCGFVLPYKLDDVIPAEWADVVIDTSAHNKGVGLIKRGLESYETASKSSTNTDNVQD